MKRFIKPVSTVGIATFITFVVRLVRMKIWSICLGLSGLGVMAQLANLLLLMNNLTLFGIRDSIVHFLGRSCEGNSDYKRDAFIYTAIISVLFMSALWLSIFLLFPSQLSHRVFSSISFKSLVMLISLAIPFTSITFLLDGLLQGFKDTARYSIASILRDAVSLVIFIPLTARWGLRGAVIAIVLVSVSSFFITFGFFNKSFPVRFKKLCLSGFDTEVLAKVLKIGFAVFVCVGSINFTMLVIRSFIIRSFGTAGHGIFQSAYGLTDAYPEFLAGCSVLYVTAYFSGLKTNEMMSGLNEFFRLGILSFVPVGCIILLFGVHLIKLVYSVHFVGAAVLLPLMVLGAFLKAGIYLIGLVFLPLLKLRIFLILQTLCQAAYILLSFLFLKIFSLQGVMAAYLVSHGILFVLLLAFLKNSSGFEFLHKNKILILNSAILIAAICLLSVFHIKAGILIGMVFFALWFIFSTTPGEKGYLKNLMKCKNEIR